MGCFGVEGVGVEGLRGLWGRSRVWIWVMVDDYEVSCIFMEFEELLLLDIR